MKNRFFKVIIVLMTLSIIALVVVQMYWLKQAFDAKESDFNSRIYKSLDETIATVKKEELDKYYDLFASTLKTMKDSANKPEVITSQIESDSANVKYVYLMRSIVEKTSIPLSKYYNDSLDVTELYSSEKSIKVKKDSSNFFRPLEVNLDNEFKNGSYTIERFARLNSGNMPIDKRVNLKVIDSIFNRYLKKWNTYTPFELAILNSDSTIAIQDKGYVQKAENFTLPLFEKQNNKTSYYLSAYLPQKKRAIFSNYSKLAIITIVATLLILVIYMISIYAMIKQRQISQMKTDFMNNMTHEFKTPIATISVASDSLKSKMVSENPDKVKYYANLIKQENKRMNQQVETILRLSKLERQETQLERSVTHMNALVQDSVDSIRLIVENRNGTIFENYKARKDELSVDSFHMGNIILNVLDNANKYSPEAPKITVETYNENSYYIIKISDEGIGMSKNVVGKIFEKFYREETGNIHNVKGHGLGLAYVKHIVDLHKGEIKVESTKGKGTSFYLKLPIKK